MTATNMFVTKQAERLGSYNVTEAQAPENFYNAKETKKVTISYAGQTAEAAFSETTFTNDRQKAVVQVIKKDKDTENTLSGGHFALFAAQDMKTVDGKVAVKKDALIETAITGTDGKAAFKADLPVGFSYYVKEVQAPAGYVRNEKDTYSFQFSYAVPVGRIIINKKGEFVKEVTWKDMLAGGMDAAFGYVTGSLKDVTFEIYAAEDIKAADGESSDYYKKDELVATITTDALGYARSEDLPLGKYYVKEWTSGSTPHIIKELEVGKKYTLTETIPADGYATAESITFVVENTADIQKVEMQDDTTKILISKVDMTDGSSEVKGAKLYILNENQEVMESWTSGDQHHYVEKLPIGTYTLLEETAPKGYIVANKVTFEIKDTGDIQGTKMEDEQAMGKVILNKTDKDTKKPMKGVEFALCDSKGKVLETLVTDSAGHAESKNYPIATFKNGQYKKAITYILKETKTLDGYQLDETEHKIQFEYVNDRTPVIEYTLDLTNKKAPEKDTPETSENQGVSTPVSHGSDATSVSNSPKTGDNTNIAIFVLALAVSAGCLGTVVTVKRKRK